MLNNYWQGYVVIVVSLQEFSSLLKLNTSHQNKFSWSHHETKRNSRGLTRRPKEILMVLLQAFSILGKLHTPYQKKFFWSRGLTTSIFNFTMWCSWWKRPSLELYACMIIPWLGMCPLGVHSSDGNYIIVYPKLTYIN